MKLKNCKIGTRVEMKEDYYNYDYHHPQGRTGTIIDVRIGDAYGEFHDIIVQFDNGYIEGLKIRQLRRLK